MKKIIACIIVYLLMVVFMFTAIKLNAAEIGKEYNAKEQSFSKAILRTDSNTHVAVDITFEEYYAYFVN